MVVRKTLDGKEVSILGFGMMRLPVKKDGKTIDQGKVNDMVKLAFEKGINYFDTAYYYHDGKSENAVKEALKPFKRESYFLADKLPGWSIKSTEEAEKVFENQLERCGVDYFDFYLCHALDKAQFINKYEKLDLLSVLIKKKAEGKIKRLGFSYHDAAENLDYIASAYNWDFAQLQINYLDWELQNAKLQYEVLTSKNIPVVVMEPVRGGALATLCSEAESILKSKHDWSTASWALRYVMSLENVLTVLSGMSNAEQVSDNINTAKSFKPLTSDERECLELAKGAYTKAVTVPCTGCRYCMDCPFGVDIPKNFSVYNDFQLNRNKDDFKNKMKELSNASAANCKNCNKCKENCPQNIDIPNELKKVDALYND